MVAVGVRIDVGVTLFNGVYGFGVEFVYYFLGL